MCKTSLLCGAALIASVAVGFAAEVGTQGNIIPDFASANFGWQLATGLDFRPIEGKLAPIGAAPGYSPGRGIERLSDAQYFKLREYPMPEAKTADF